LLLVHSFIFYEMCLSIMLLLCWDLLLICVTIITIFKWWFWSFGYFGYGTQKWFDMQYVVWLLRCDHIYREHWGWWPKDINYQNLTWIYIMLLHDKHIHMSQWRNWNKRLKSKNVQGHSFVFWISVDQQNKVLMKL